MQQKRKRRPLWLKIVLLFLLADALLFAGWHVYLALAIRSELNAIRRAGYPVTLAELDAWYPTPPAGKNAADVLAIAFSRRVVPQRNSKLPYIGEGRMPPIGLKIPTPLRREIAQVLAQNAAALRMLHRGAALKDCRYPINLNQGMNTLLPHLAQLRFAARLLALEAAMRVDANDPDGAVDSIITSFRLARSLRNEPVLVSQMVSCALCWTSMDTLRRSVAGVQFTESQLPAISRELEEMESPGCLTRGYVGATCTSFQLTRDRKTYGDLLQNWLPDLMIVAYRAFGLVQSDRLHLLRVMRRYIGVSQLPLQLRVPESKTVLAGYSRIPHYCVATFALTPEYAQLVERGYTRVVHVERDTERIALLRSARTILAIERFRLAKSRTPDRLDELVPTYLDAVPADPFDAKPVRYKKYPRHYVVYSVGPDGRDDDGKQQDLKNPDAPYDVSFFVNR